MTPIKHSKKFYTILHFRINLKAPVLLRANAAMLNIEPDTKSH